MNLPRISIVGGGIGGLCAALALQHFGYRVRVFEQARELREVGAGVAISPNAMHALNFLGVGDRVAKEAGPAGPYVSRQPSQVSERPQHLHGNILSPLRPGPDAKLFERSDAKQLNPISTAGLGV